MKRIIAMTLILALTLAMFTGCSKTGSQPDGKPQPDSTGAASETEGKTAYQAAFLKLPDGLDTVQSSVFTDGALFLAAMNRAIRPRRRLTKRPAQSTATAAT